MLDKTERTDSTTQGYVTIHSVKDNTLDKSLYASYKGNKFVHRDNTELKWTTQGSEKLKEDALHSPDEVLSPTRTIFKGSDLCAS